MLDLPVLTTHRTGVKLIECNSDAFIYIYTGIKILFWFQGVEPGLQVWTSSCSIQLVGRRDPRANNHFVVVPVVLLPTL